MTQIDVRTVSDVIEELDGPGWGGGGWGDDDSGGWGWSEGPFGEEDARPYRRSRLARTAALVTVALVVTGSIGTSVAILAVGSPRPSFSAGSVRMAVAEPRQPGAVEPTVTVRFVVDNDSAVSGRAECRAVVSTASGTVGATSVRTVKLSSGQSASLTAPVVLSATTALVGHGPATAHVRCIPLASVRPG